MKACEVQIERLADLIERLYYKVYRPIVLLGKINKPKKPAVDPLILLLVNLLKERQVRFMHYDPYVDGPDVGELLERPHLFFLATKHEMFRRYQFKSGSVIIDPFHYFEAPSGVVVVYPGAQSRNSL